MITSDYLRVTSPKLPNRGLVQFWRLVSTKHLLFSDMFRFKVCFSFLGIFRMFHDFWREISHCFPNPPVVQPRPSRDRHRGWALRRRPWRNHGKTMRKPWENHGKGHHFIYLVMWVKQCHKHHKQLTCGDESNPSLMEWGWFIVEFPALVDLNKCYKHYVCTCFKKIIGEWDAVHRLN